MQTYGSAKVEQEFAKNRCRAASCSLRCLKLSKRLSFLQKTFSQNGCTLRLEFICERKIGTKMIHIQI